LTVNDEQQSWGENRLFLLIAGLIAAFVRAAVWFGCDFVCMERKKRIIIDGDDFKIDLLVYHRDLLNRYSYGNCDETVCVYDSESAGFSRWFFIFLCL
jgi:hypothetical protein